jgi:glutamate synthase domain-containing protein 2
MCSGYGSHVCPVGMATQDEKKRASYLVVKEGREIGNYHKNLIKSMRVILAVMGVKNIHDISQDYLTFKNRSGEIYFNISDYFKQKLHL